MSVVRKALTSIDVYLSFAAEKNLQRAVFCIKIWRRNSCVKNVASLVFSTDLIECGAPQMEMEKEYSNSKSPSLPTPVSQDKFPKNFANACKSTKDRLKSLHC